MRRQLGEYFAGRREEFDLVLSPRGTPFELAVWEELRRIPFGETRSYADIAPRAGQARRHPGRRPSQRRQSDPPSSSPVTA